MIVKVQLSLRTTEPRRQALIYNEARTIEWSGDASDDVIAAMGDDDKAFFSATFRSGVVEINDRVSDRNW